MLNMEPSIKRGLTFWDRALMPRDEFEQRHRRVREAMRRNDFRALVVAGNMYEDTDLAYIIGPGVDGTLVLTPDHDPVIFTASGSRESYFLRELTWIADVSHRGYLLGAAVREALASRGITAGRIGCAGLQVLARAPYDNLVGALPAYELDEAGPMLATLRATLRPRERDAMRIALGMARAGADAALLAFSQGASNAAAVVEAERVARREGAWDVRILANLDGDELRPFERSSDARRSPLNLWIAARYQGYWADTVVAAEHGGSDEAAAAVAAMVEASRIGVRAEVVAAAGLAQLPQTAQPLALAYGLGRGIGAALDIAPFLAPGHRDELKEGMIVSFHVFARRDAGAAFAGGMVEITAHGARPVTPLERGSFGGYGG